VTTAHDKAKQILSEHRDQLDQVAHKLIEVETLDAKEFAALMSGLPIEPPQVLPGAPPVPQARPASEPPNWQVGPAPAPIPA
jgi:cell division protease FtsH